MPSIETQEHLKKYGWNKTSNNTWSRDVNLEPFTIEFDLERNQSAEIRYGNNSGAWRIEESDQESISSIEDLPPPLGEESDDEDEEMIQEEIYGNDWEREFRDYQAGKHSSLHWMKGHHEHLHKLGREARNKGWQPPPDSDSEEEETSESDSKSEPEEIHINLFEEDEPIIQIYQ